jgi:hypothetical protein
LETPVLPIENVKPIRRPATSKLVDLRASNSSLKEAAFSGDFLAAKKLGLKLPPSRRNRKLYDIWVSFIS